LGYFRSESISWFLLHITVLGLGAVVSIIVEEHFPNLAKHWSVIFAVIAFVWGVPRQITPVPEIVGFRYFPSRAFECHTPI